MDLINNSNTNRNQYPIRILQYGEGNFLRAFVDWFVEKMNRNHGYNSGIAVVQPIAHGLVKMLNDQDGLYHHVIQGKENGETIDEVVLNSSIQKLINPFDTPEAYFELAGSTDLRLIFSNTTEAGIAFDNTDKPGDTELARTFPGKLTQLLYKRFEALGADGEIGIIPCELIESNGIKLAKCVDQYIDLWQLGEGFKSWVAQSVHFANTLVDRIVPGYPKDEIDTLTERIGKKDNLIVKSETFHLFVIEGDDFIRKHFPADQYGFNVKYVESIVPYRTQKVRILNGAHTSMVPVGLLAGIETVREAVEDGLVGKFIKQAIFDEIVATISIPNEDPKVFAEQVLARFENPFIRHELMSISLNSVSKWRVRVLPTLLDYCASQGSLPKCLTFSLASLIKFYISGDFELKDDVEVLEFFQKLKAENLTSVEITDRVLGNESLWQQDLREVAGLADAVGNYLDTIDSNTFSKALEKIL